MAQVREERESDHAAVRRVHRAAFERDDEADLVDALRGSPAAVPGLSLVAEEDGAVVGHLLMTRATLDGGTDVLVLAPMAVLPERQGAGVGGALVREALARARRTAFALVSVLGHAGYYPRFGFEPAAPLGVRCPFAVPDEAWMVLRLPAWDERARGTLVYPPAFGL